jgi:hypothetical protein
VEEAQGKGVLKDFRFFLSGFLNEHHSPENLADSPAEFPLFDGKRILRGKTSYRWSLRVTERLKYIYEY